MTSQTQSKLKKYKNLLIPNDWKVHKFKDAILIQNGQVDPKQHPYSNMYHVGLANIEKLTGRLLEVKTAKEEGVTSGKYFFQKGDVLYGKIRPELGKVYYAEFDGVCSADIYPLKGTELVDSLFLKYVIFDRRFYQYAVSTSVRTGLPKVNREDLGSYDLILPPKKEQQKIASILTTWDKAIDLKEKLIEQKREQKKGLVQSLLTGNSRFTGFNGDWKSIRLKEILSVRNEKSVITDKLPLYSLTIEEGVTEKTDRYNREFLVKGEGKNYKITKNGDIVYNPSNLRFGAIALNKIEKPVLLSPIYEVLFIKDTEKWDMEYIAQTLTSSRQIKIFSTKAEGTLVERMAVKIDAFLNTEIYVPMDIEEQKKIAKVLNLIDKEVELLKNELDDLKEQKKGLMQLLLTGTVRVKV
ncbi:restriction endonuclease subunit S [Peribacillus asahii]|uniref:restriction endonuclease subunit S n=1 Tax=Peribacillus asahii TaxID=228899 RepID=UPI00207A72A6|nr:restriction endonuclease subunit S [Peribacillus asahii]USK60391.1 restriction endonuclease subunit S [Peribacillus asahii]